METTRLIIERTHVLLTHISAIGRNQRAPRREFGVKKGINKLLWDINLAKRIGLCREGILLNTASKIFSRILNQEFFVKSGTLVNFHKSLYYTSCNGVY